MASLTFVVPGQTLSTESGFLKGHGTYVQDISTSSSSNSGNSPPLPEGSDNLLIEAAPESDQLAPDDKSLVPTKETSEGTAREGTAREGTAPDGPTPPAKRQRLVASCAGVIQRVNRLISVIPLRQAYNGEVGDLVVGQVTEVSNKRWKLRIGATRDSSLNLSSVNLPGGVQRIRTYEDQLQMRTIFVEGDLVSAEVQSLMGDGTASLHTRSLRYGKLVNGVLVTVPSSLVRRQKQHFVTLPCNVDVLLGCNGFIWIQRTTPDSWKDENAMDLPKAETLQALRKRHAETPNSEEEEKKMLRVKNSISILKTVFRFVNAGTIMDVYDKSVSLGLSLMQMLTPENIVKCSEGTRVQIMD